LQDGIIGNYAILLFCRSIVCVFSRLLCCNTNDTVRNGKIIIVRKIFSTVKSCSQLWTPMWNASVDKLG